MTFLKALLSVKGEGKGGLKGEGREGEVMGSNSPPTSNKLTFSDNFFFQKEL